MKYIGIYTLLFLVTFVFAYSPFLLSGKTFVWSGDGRSQSYPALIYIKLYLLQTIRNLISGNFFIQNFDYNIGVGADIISTLNYYGLGDPLNFLALFFRLENIEWLHGFLEIFYVYMAGISFSILCMYQKKQHKYIYVGALIYAYSGYAVIYATKYIFFISPMFQFPLLIMGADLIIRGKKSLFFTFMVFYSALCGFYFFYMMTIMGSFYVIIRILTGRYAGNLKNFIRLTGKIVLYYLLGTGMAAGVFLPAIMGFLSSNRSGKSYSGSYFFYNKGYYLQCLIQFIAPTNLWIGLSLAAITLFALIFLIFSDRKKYMDLKLLLAAALVVYFIPLGGSIMNGFSYPTPRWTFGISLLISYITVEMLPVLLSMGRRQKNLCIGTGIGYVILYLSAIDKNIFYLGGVVLLAVTFVTLQLIGKIKERKLVLRRFPHADIMICILLVIFNVGINALFKFAAGGWAGGYAKYGAETELMRNAYEQEAVPYLTDYAGRFDSIDFFANRGFICRVPTLYSYWSVTNQYVMEYWKQTENTKLAGLAINGSDERTVTDALLAVKYYIEGEDQLQFLPYGYKMIKETENGRSIFENEHALPWGYTYNSYTSYENLEQMNGLEIEEIMLQSIVLDEKPDGITGDLPEVTSIKVPYEIVEQKGVVWKNGELQVIEEGGEITVKFQMPAQSEGYFRLQGFIDNGYDRSFVINIKSNDRDKYVTINSTSYRWYSGENDYMINLGYAGGIIGLN